MLNSYDESVRIAFCTFYLFEIDGLSTKHLRELRYFSITTRLEIKKLNTYFIYIQKFRKRCSKNLPSQTNSCVNKFNSVI